MWEKPLPNIDKDNKVLFEGYQQGEFRLFRCQQCGDWYWPKAFCRNHDNEPHFGNIDVEPASGRGEVFAFTINHRPFAAGFDDDIPYTFAMIKLEEGPMFGSQLLEVEPDDVELGLPVEVKLVDVPEEEVPEEKRQYLILEDGFTLPYFVPREAAR